ncbi:MAG: STAS domain-containing protein [Desulfobacterales bacterium]|nr:STAS domain-containing protein [Desulfobacterales bacterium]
MEVSAKKDKKAVIFTVKGRVDAITSPELEKKLVAEIGGDEKNFIINMRGLDYISSAGLRVILFIAKKIKSKQGDILLVGLQGSVKEVFEISGFLSIFKVFDTEEAALNYKV